MVGRRRVLAVQPALVASQHPAVLLLGGPSTEKVNLYLPKLPDGTVVWTSPTGHTYTTYPGSKHLFPTLCEPTGTLWTGEPPTVDTNGDRGVMMPKRRHTRAHNRAKAVSAERRLNDALVAERNRPPPF